MSQAIFIDGLGYEGKVTLTLKSNNRIITSKTYKNNGTNQLFKFLGECLKGNFGTETKKLVPNKILLLENKSGDTPMSAQPTAAEPRSLWQAIVQAPTLISDDATSQVRVTYSFEVPKAAITGSFNQVALYGAEINQATDFSAYYYLVDDTGAFESQDASTWSTTTVLLIEWELSLSNKNIETNDRAGESEEND